MNLFILLLSNFAISSHTGMGMGSNNQQICSSISCVYNCNGKCGWSSIFNSCLYGFHTSQNEINNAYGCTTSTTLTRITSTIPSTTQSTTLSSITSTIPSTTQSTTLSSITSTIPSTTHVLRTNTYYLIDSTISYISTLQNVENNETNTSNLNISIDNTKNSSDNTSTSNLIIPLSIAASVFVSIFILFLFLRRKKNNFNGIENENNQNNEGNEENKIIVNNKDSNLYLEPTPLTRQKHIFNNHAYTKNDIYDKTYEEINDNTYVYETDTSNTENIEYTIIND